MNTIDAFLSERYNKADTMLRKRIVYERSGSYAIQPSA